MIDNQKSKTELKAFRKRRPKDSLSESTFRIRKKDGLLRDENSPLFDQTIIHTDSIANELANDILKAQSTRTHKKKFTKCALAVIANLHMLYIENLGSPYYEPMSIHMNNNRYTNLPKQLKHISTSFLRPILSYLSDNNYVEKVGGYNDRENNGANSKITRIYTKPKLEWFLRKCSSIKIQSCTNEKLLIKMTKENESGRKVVFYPSKPKTMIDKMNRNLKRINDVNSSHKIGLGLDSLLFAFMERINKDLGIITRYDRESIDYIANDYLQFTSGDTENKSTIYPYPFLALQDRLFYIHTYKIINLPPNIQINSSNNHTHRITLAHTHNTFSITKTTNMQVVENKKVSAEKIHAITQRFMKYLNLKDKNGKIDLTPYIGYTRIFSRGSFDYGGRYYESSILDMPKQLRKFLQINGENTVEPDYKCMHLRMLYQKKGISNLQGNLYGDNENFPKSVIKMAVNMLLNAKDVTAATRALHRKNNCMYDYKGCKKVIDWVLTEHDIIKEYLGSDMGVKLQRLDSDIAERIMLHFANLGEACFSVHDSFIVRKGLESELRKVMKDVYVDIIGDEPVIE